MSNEIKSALDYADQNGIEPCEYCRYKFDCRGGITSDGNGNPVYPPCGDGEPECWVDEDVLLERVQDEKER